MGWHSAGRILTAITLISVLALGWTTTLFAEPKGNLIIFHAGSLTVPFAKMEKVFETKYPKVDVLREAGGSTKMARLISEHNMAADIMASADYKVIDKTLIPSWADWNIRFATNQLVLCYTEKSRFADKVGTDNWYEILGRKEVSWGHSDPNLDPCSYRSLMVLQLAEKYYKQFTAYTTEYNKRRKAKKHQGIPDEATKPIPTEINVEIPQLQDQEVTIRIKLILSVELEK